MFRPAVRKIGNILPKVGMGSRGVSTFLQKYVDSVNALPHREAVQYVGPEIKLTAEKFHKYGDQHANAWLEVPLVQPGETLAVWLPERAEKHIIMMAAAKGGFKVVDIDINITQVSEVRECMRLAQCKVLYFQTQHENTDHILLLRKSIPEFFHYDDGGGQMFHSKYYPTMRYFVHMGNDNEVGALNMKELMLKDPPKSYLAKAFAATTDATPLYRTISKAADGSVKASEWVTHGDILKHPNWTFAKNHVESQYFELP